MGGTFDEFYGRCWMLAAEGSITTGLIVSFGLYSYKSLRTEIESRSLVSGFARWFILVNRDRYVVFSKRIYPLYNFVTIIRNTNYHAEFCISSH